MVRHFYVSCRYSIVCSLIGSLYLINSLYIHSWVDINFEKESLFSFSVSYYIRFVTSPTYSNWMYFLYSKQKINFFLKSRWNFFSEVGLQGNKELPDKYFLPPSRRQSVVLLRSQEWIHWNFLLQDIFLTSSVLKKYVEQLIKKLFWQDKCFETPCCTQPNII